MNHTTSFLAPAFFTGVTRKAFLWRGILVLAAGLLIALDPVFSLEFISKILGVLFSVIGIWVVLSGTFESRQRFFWILYGLALLIWGLFLVFQPFKVLFLVAWLVALWFTVGGVAGIWNTAQLPADGKYKVLPLISGLVGLFIGFIFFVWPLTSMAGMLWVAGLLLVIRGIMLIAFSRIVPELPDETGGSRSEE